MAWVALDDQIFMNRKVAQCDPSSKLLYIVGLVYCGNQLTDGFIPQDTLPLLAGMAGIDLANAKQNVSKLVSIGLWNAIADMWHIPDYLDYNPSREQVLHKKSVRKAAGKLGGMAKSSKILANATANAKQNPSKTQPPTPSPSPIQRDEGLGRPPASPPPPSQEPADPEYGAALSKLEALGMMTGSALLEFQALWPDLNNGKRQWIDDAITVAQANSANSPVYAVRVLANWTKNGRDKPRAHGNGKPRERDLDALLGIK
jgi:hypothetical protein